MLWTRLACHVQTRHTQKLFAERNAPVGGVEEVSVREPGRHAKADQLEDATEDRQLVHGVNDA